MLFVSFSLVLCDSILQVCFPFYLYCFLGPQRKHHQKKKEDCFICHIELMSWLMFKWDSMGLPISHYVLFTYMELFFAQYSCSLSVFLFSLAHFSGRLLLG